MYSKKWFLTLVAPSFIVFSIVMLVPTLMGILLSFTDWKQGEDMFASGWIGFANYRAAFNNGGFINAIWYTFVFTIFCVVIINLIGFGLALLLNKAFRGRNLFRSAFFVPNLIGGLILGYLWRLIFDQIFVSIFGGSSLRLESQFGAMIAMALVVSWQSAGYVMIIYIAALQNVNKSLDEASRIEGAGIMRRFYSVTLPAVAPAITVAVFLVLSGSFKLFDQNLALTEGANNSGLLAYDIYGTAFIPSYTQTYGVAQAKSVIFTILVSMIALMQVYFSKKMEVQQ
ncbi:raffinose/stachyose/melibiose transport system permease protein [Mycoplasmoides fastidiosum]|uniref:Raffinose/stachyose/melibiose transport system permease protein n=1 Tax=Mycoplasmoides fastidiosum TaxID=92758 RepID=A0ABU0LYS5_9BACT|nr:sugar ABC transporter permease [Mycoplasmoides fastidiosum]MDQ0513839.1 raffinose/stachyose/melibiose transport system permease protein [Mycoplasmoides fastidiosum]UUD37745.1 sugar ABC transporter permease [Mycoplasmoides fastidiosum]